jgi:cytochrome P450
MIPGPKSWGASQLPFIKSFLQGTIIKDTEKLHWRYGPILRIGPDEVILSHPDAWADILQLRPGHQQFPKDSLWWNHAGPTSILSAIDAHTHTRIRNALIPGFTDRALRAQEPILLQYIDLLIERLREKVGVGTEANEDGVVIDILPWLNFTTFDIFGDLGFGEPCTQTQGTKSMSRHLLISYPDLKSTASSIPNTIHGLPCCSTVSKRHLLYRPRNSTRLLIGS